MKVQVVPIRNDHARVAIRLVGIHRALDALGQAHRLDRRTEPPGRGFKEALEEGLDARENAHRGRS
ncbi:MAG: hypothetical protein WKH68_04350 [Candidatus Limnocylindria bacterium]